MAKKFELLLLDANVVIYLFKLGIWDKVVTQCDIRLARIVVEEAHFYETDEGERVDFDLAPYVAAAQVHVFDVMPSDLVRFRRTFKTLFLEQMDPGETESLAWLLANPSEPHLCSADAIVFRVLGALGLAERGISLEEVLSQIGLGHALPHQFSRKFRDRWTKKGFEEGLRGLGLKDSPLA